ncbi:iron transporter, partial [Streptomyces sp. DT225]
FLGGLRNRAFDISSTIPPDSWYGTLLKGTFNFQPDPTVLQLTVWVLYLVPALALFLSPVGFGRSVATDQKARKAADGKSEAGTAGGGTRGGDGAEPDGERVRDGARRAGSRTGGDEG